MGLVGKVEYGTWKNGSSVYKDSKGYYVVAINATGPEYKKYLKGWKPEKNAETMHFVNKRWTIRKKGKSKSKKSKTRKA